MKKRLAIISSYNEACGNASYTHVLAEEFRKHVDVDIIPLDLYLLQSNFPSVIRSAEKHVDEICEQIRDYDYVNIQFELGLYGLAPKRAVSRVLRIIEAAGNVVVTMHRVDYEGGSKLRSFYRAIARLSPKSYMIDHYANRHIAAYRTLLKAIGQMNADKNVAIMVHTRRERKILRYIFGLENVRDFPITFLTPEKREKYLKADRTDFHRKYGLSDGQKSIGIFGFISSYKGHDVAVKAMQLLPSEYQLLIFGSQHPQSIEKNTSIDPFLSSVLTEVDNSQRGYRGSFSKQEGITSFEIRPVEKPTVPLRERVHFIGNLDDDEFISALRCCDAVVLPYIETGQSMSGVAALTLETRSHAFFANNLSFIELRKYYGKSFHSFDIGNYMELAQKIMLAKPGRFDEQLDEAFNIYNIEENIKVHLDMFEHGEHS